MPDSIDSKIDWTAFYAEMTGQQPKPAGLNKRNICCPFHKEKNPSFWFNTENGCWKCETGCGSGNATTFLARIKNIDSAEAYKELLQRAGVDHTEPARRTKIALPTTLEEYAEAKNIPLEACARLGMANAVNPHGPAYVAIPYFDENGKRVAVKHRHNPKNTVRFSWDKGGTVIPYGVWLDLNKTAEEIVLVEGESDAQSLWLHRIPALGIPGATNFQEGWTKYLTKAKRLIIHQQPDAGGDKFRQKTCQALYAGGYKGAVAVISANASFNDCKDPSDVHAKKADFAAAWAAIIGRAENVDLSAEGMIVNEAKQTARPEKEIKPLVTYKASDLYGVHLDRPPVIINSMVPAGLTVLAGAPKRGKSWLALKMAVTVAGGEPFFGQKTEKGDVLYLDLESRQYRVQDRLSKIIAGRAPDLLQIAHESGRLEAGLTEQLAMWCDSVQHPVLIIIDTLGRVKGGSRKGENAYEGDTRILGDLQKFAMERHLAIVCVHHLRKSTAGDSDYFERISGSMGLTGACDSVMVLAGKRGEVESTLSISGRDFEQTELTIGFNGGQWSLLSTDSETYRAEKEYTDSALVRSVILIAERYHTWEGSPRTLMDTIMDNGAVIDEIDVRQVGANLKKYQQMLHDRDGVLVSWQRNRTSRLIRIMKVDRESF